MNTEIAAQLRAKFTKNQIGHLPKITCPDCSNARQTKVCGKHTKTRCPECRNYITSAHIHIDYVGHAHVTDRLLQVDPTWTWEPAGFDERGLPAIDQGGNLWIKLTVAGVTRWGVGDGSSMKEKIGDAIRNAAMRFGVAVDLWMKEDPDSDQAVAVEGAARTRTVSRDQDAAKPTRPKAVPPRPPLPGETAPDVVSRPQIAKILALFDECEWTDRADRLRATSALVGRKLGSANELTKTEASALIDKLEQVAKDPDPAVALQRLVQDATRQEGDVATQGELPTEGGEAA